MLRVRGAPTARRAVMVSPSTPLHPQLATPSSLHLLYSRTPFAHLVSPFISQLSLERGPLTLVLHLRWLLLPRGTENSTALTILTLFPLLTAFLTVRDMFRACTL